MAQKTALRANAVISGSHVKAVKEKKRGVGIIGHDSSLKSHLQGEDV